MVTFADFDTANELRKNKTVVARLRENISEFDFILEFGDLTYADGDMEVYIYIYDDVMQTNSFCDSSSGTNSSIMSNQLQHASLGW